MKARLIISRAVRLRGKLNEGALQSALNAIVARHETLRTNFVNEAAEPVQIIHAAREIKLQTVDVHAHSAAERDAEVMQACAAAARQGFDLARHELLRATLFRLFTYRAHSL